MKTIIAVPDFTREAHLKKVLPSVLAKLKGQDIEIIIATGLHRPPTKKEIKTNLGNIANRVKISVHDHRSATYFGKTKKGIPVYLNKKLKTADSIITVGVVEPHLYAGYSGGTKVVSIGLAGEKTINATHHPRFLDDPGTRICSIKNNPFRDFIDEASNLLPVRYSLNIVNNKTFWGKPAISFKKAVKCSQKIFEKKINKTFDVIICDIPKEKGVNIYQASRAFNYVANAKGSVLKKNSLILVKARLEEGFGKGLGERRFMNKILKMRSSGKLIKEVKKRGCLAGEHRAYMVAKAMKKAKLGFISKKAYLYKNKGLPFLSFKDTKEARAFIKQHFKKQPDILYLKNAFPSILTF